MLTYNVNIAQKGPITTNVVEVKVPRIGPLYPNIVVLIRYKIHPVTGLFIYDKESDISVTLSPNGWDSTSEFSVAQDSVEKKVTDGGKVFRFKSLVDLKLLDTKASIRLNDSGVDFSAPHKTESVRVYGYINTRGRGYISSSKF